MASIVQLKRSALSGKVPDTGSLNLGELAVNTYDGKIYFKKSGSIESIESVLTTNSVVTGSIRLEGTGSFGSLKVNDTLTVNHGETIMSGSALVTNDLTILGAVNARQFNISVISSSVLFESGSSRFGNTLDDTHDFTGSVNVTGSLYLNGVVVATGSGAEGTYVFPNAFDFNVDDPTFGDFNSASLGYNLNFGDVETVGSPIHFVGGLSNLGDTTVIYPTSRSIDFVVDDRYVGSISSQSFYTNTTFTASLQQGYTLVGNGSGVTYAVATSSIAGALPTGVVSGSSQIVSILSSLNTYTGSNDTTNTAQNTRLTTIESVTGSYETTGRSIVSGSSQITPLLPTGTISGSIQVLGGTGIISSSTQLENATITNLTITNLTTVNETASVIFSSGSNRFGDFGDDIHSFTGSVKISGSLTTIGSSTATSFSGAIAATNGVVSGSSQVDVMSTTNIARLATTGSNTFSGITTFSGFGSNAFSAGGTGYNKLTLRNTTAGVANGAQLSVGTDADADQFYIGSFSTTFTTNGMNIAGGAVINGEGPGGLSIAATQSNIGFYTNGGAASNLRMNISSDGTIQQYAGTNQATAGAYNTFGNLYVASTTAQGTDIGGSISIGGKYNGAGAYATFARIQGKKENGSSGQTGGYLAFETNTDVTNNLTERMRIVSNGAVTIASSIAGEVILNVQNSSSTGNGLVIGAGSTSSHFVLKVENYNGSLDLFQVKGDGTVKINQLTSNGTVATQSSNGTLYVSSDANLKIEDGYIENGLEKVLALKPRYFYWKDKEVFSADRQLGFYAQEVNAISEETANTPAEGCGWGIYDRGLVALLTSAIQEQNATITELKERLTAGGL